MDYSTLGTVRKEPHVTHTTRFCTESFTPVGQKTNFHGKGEDRPREVNEITQPTTRPFFVGVEKRTEDKKGQGVAKSWNWMISHGKWTGFRTRSSRGSAYPFKFVVQHGGTSHRMEKEVSWISEFSRKFRWPISKSIPITSRKPTFGFSGTSAIAGRHRSIHSYSSTLQVPL